MSIHNIIQRCSKAGLALVVALGLVAWVPAAARAAVQSPAATAKVSFTFDDGLVSALNKAAPTLQKYGFAATNYVITNCVGMTAVPNTCAADENVSYMTWAQIQTLRSTYGWEVGSHTQTHPQLATDKLNANKLETEINGSKTALAAQGIDATAFASPFGDYTPKTMAVVAKYYETHRGFWDTGYNVWPNDDYLLRVQQVQVGVTVAQVKAYVDAAAAANQWLVLVFHEIRDVPNTDPEEFQYATADLDAIAAYVKQKNLSVVRVSDGVVKDPSVNMLSNSTFDQGLTGWTTDNATAVKANAASNGSYPSPVNSVAITANTKVAHLFSPQVAVSNTQTYVLKSFVNLSARTSGELGFYVDEFDANGVWISGQWKRAESVVVVKTVNFAYTPSSANVKKARLQVYATASSGVKAFIDNVRWFPLDGTAPTPPPAPTNLVANSTFDAGLSGGWTADSPAITADAANHGSPDNIKNSIQLGAGTTKNAHLFSPKVAVDSTKTYSLINYLSVVKRTAGEVSFYIDEYDANGVWISGQWKAGVAALGANDLAFAYTPSSANVKTAALQVIVTANSGIQAYIDNVRWYLN